MNHQELAAVPIRSSTGRNVKSDAAGAADAHEREKNFLTETEIMVLLEAVKAGRHGVRNHLLVLMMYRHGMRVSETVDLRRDEVDLDRSRLWVRRLKNGLSVEQPISGDELRAIRRYLATRTDALPWLFISEREQPLTRQSVNHFVATAALRAGLSPVNPHMLGLVVTLMPKVPLREWWYFSGLRVMVRRKRLKSRKTQLFEGRRGSGCRTWFGRTS